MSSVVLSGDTSGTITVAVPAVAGSNTATLPAATGTVMVSGNMPAFSATMSAAQSITTGVYTKVQFNTEDFDTNSNYDTTNYRFTPTVAGYYQINLSIYATGTSLIQINLGFYKNGSLVKGTAVFGPNVSSVGGMTSSIIYCNGSTDYIEAYGLISGTSPIFQNGNFTFFNGSLVRAA